MLATKLHVPRLPRTFVDRPRLVELFDRAPPGTLTLVCAPPGFGKSVLVADWCRRRRASTAWVSLDRGDDEPVRFWRHVAGAIDRARTDPPAQLGDAVDRIVRAASDRFDDAIVAAVIDGLVPVRDDLVLVLDDYHLIDDARVHASVRSLVDHAPERLRVVVITRADPPLLLARRRARGELTEIRSADLRFRTDEAGGLLRAVTGIDLAEPTVDAMAARTEGWAAGLQLAGLSLERCDDIESYVASFSGSHRFVLDYLTEEVLDRLPARMRTFLVETSILERLSGPVCDAVTGRTDSQELLEEGERSNLFLVPLDEERRWWRYHHLFADLLGVRLRQLDAAHVRELHVRAADWHDDHGLVAAAVRHALSADDPARASRVIERHADELLLRREGATLQRQLDQLPAHLGTRRLLLAQARTASYAGRPSEAERLILAAEAAPEQQPDESFEPSIARTASPLASPDPTTTLLRAFVAHLRGRNDEAEALASGTLDDLGDTRSALTLIAELHLASAPWMRGNVNDADAALTTNVERWRAAGEHERAAWSAHYLGRVRHERGDLGAALDTYRAVRTLDVAVTGDDSPAAGIASVGLAAVAYQRDDLDTARRHATEGIERCRQFVYTQALASGLSTLAWIRHAEGDQDGARAAMREAIDVGPDPDVVDLLNPVPTEHARLELALGQPDAARAWVDHRGVTPDDEPRHDAEPAHLLLARLLIDDGRADDALGLLGRLRTVATGDGRFSSAIEIDVLRARALDAAGSENDAVRTLAAAIVRGSRHGHVRVFVDEGAPVASLLGRMAATPSLSDELDVALDHVTRISRSFRSTPPGGDGDGGRANEGLVVPLTDREVEVLVQLATGRKNQEIATELYVSLHTVKKHVTHIFDKLGVTNRTSAVARARALDLLP